MIGVQKPTESIMKIMSADRQLFIDHNVAVGDGMSFDSLGWVDLPIMMQKEEHPSRAVVRKRCSADNNSPWKNVLRERNTTCSNTLHKPTATSTSTKCEPLSFGWSDFPIAIEQQVFSKKTNPSFSPSSINKQHSTLEHVSSSTMENHPLIVVRPSCPNRRTRIPILRTTPLPTERPFGWADFLSVNDHPTEPRQKHSVQFSHVRIRNHAVCLGDHPLCEEYPLSLDWTHSTVEQVISVDTYEEQHRTGVVVKLDGDARRSRLSEAMGVSLTALDALEAKRTAVPITPGGLPRVRRVVLDHDHPTHWP